VKKEGYDLLIAAEEPEIEKVAASLRSDGAEVEAVQAGCLRSVMSSKGRSRLCAAEPRQQRFSKHVGR
jgi:uncharacterized protein